MSVPFVVFDAATGDYLWHGVCPAEAVKDQAGEGQRALATSALTLEGNRLVIWEAVRNQRNAATDAGAPTPFGAVDSDEAARSNVSGAALGALIAKSAGAPYAVTWTMLDNTTVTLDADGMIGLGLAVLTHVNACHERAREFRAQIEATANMAELLAIDVTAGWPSVGTEG